ncbi:nucleotide exchange factor GrpE [Brevibacterium renqingii]|uniref:nucleotide exchange factor GrpE n=1 Tax=Brevibacterium renqingii TaxID=2776916 RepID=UPI001AE0C427|nr:nucleotide exchange factor GrpE [Brevibacterium renqingii]
MTAEGNDQSSEEPGFTFSDKRRVDPNTGEVRPEADDQSASAGVDEEQVADPNSDQVSDADQTGSGSADASDLGVDIPADASDLEDTEPSAEPEPGSEAAAHLADLKRINAEYAAYRMRADRERERAALGGTIKVIEALIPVLDEVKLARENGDVTGPFETHVNKLIESLGKLGVEQYGEVGDEFDPNIHEALMQQPSDDVENPTVFLVMQPGYRIGERIIRAARVGVQQPED